jgi:hypothetical protein
MQQEAMNGKALKFRALAEQRVSKVINTIRRIGNLSRRTTYDYNAEQIAKMFSAMRGELDSAEQKFAPPTKNKQQQTLFRLD